MRRLLLHAVPVTLLALVAIGNWETTCCCGRSCIQELVEGGCGEFGTHAHHHHGHDAGEDAGCRKDHAETFLASQPDELRPDPYAGGGPTMRPADPCVWSWLSAGGGRHWWYRPALPDSGKGLSFLHCSLLI